MLEVPCQVKRCLPVSLLSAGFAGFALGATPTAVASICQHLRSHQNSWACTLSLYYTPTRRRILRRSSKLLHHSLLSLALIINSINQSWRKKKAALRYSPKTTFLHNENMKTTNNQ